MPVAARERCYWRSLPRDEIAATCKGEHLEVGRELLGLITRNLGAEWTADFLGADMARIGAHVLKHLQQRYDKPHNQIKSLAELVHDDWQGSRDPRFPRGMRVMARSQLQDRPSANPDYDAQWFPARILGVGMTPTTYELLFDARLDGDEEDRHDRTFPFLAKKADDLSYPGRVESRVGWKRQNGG